MSAAASLKKANASRVELYVEAGRLRGRGARPGPELAAELREHEAEIVALLASRESASPPAGPSPIDIAAAGHELKYAYTRSPSTESAPVAPIDAIAPIEAPWPEPAITKDPYFGFGADQVPHRYQRAWRELLRRCPPGVSEWQWAQAIYDARDLFETWGAKIEEMCWSDDDIFELPDGLIWFLEGEYVTVPGGMTAQTSGHRIWRRPRR